MTRAQMFAIASGHEDCDDLDVLPSAYPHVQALTALATSIAARAP
jgi:hypothetical protein